MDEMKKKVKEVADKYIALASHLSLEFEHEVTSGGNDLVRMAVLRSREAAYLTMSRELHEIVKEWP